MQLTKHQADLIVMAPKACREAVQWKKVPTTNNLRCYRLETDVECEIVNGALKITGVVGKRNHSFSLLYEGIPLRRYTVHHEHLNPDGARVREPHKHIWDETNCGRDTYIPDDISREDINDAFLNFLTECNIELEADYCRGIFL